MGLFNNKLKSNLPSSLSGSVVNTEEEPIETDHKGIESSGANSSPPPSYSYSDQIELNKPFTQGLNANPWRIVLNLQESMRWTLSMLKDGKDSAGVSMTMGNKYFVQSGTCDKTNSVDVCKGKPRYIYVDNVPSASFPCVSDASPIDPYVKKGGNTGLVNGVIGDMMQVNPYELIASMAGDGSVVNNKCVMRTEMVGDVYPGEPSSLQKQTVCAPKKKPLTCTPTLGSASSKDEICVNYPINPEASSQNQIVSDILSAVYNNSPKTEDLVDQSGLPLAMRSTDQTWLSLCSAVDKLFTEQLHKMTSSNTATVRGRNYCMRDLVESDTDKLLYQWSVVYEIKQATISANPYVDMEAYTYQVSWVVYCNSSVVPIAVFPQSKSKIAGNSTVHFANMPDGHYSNGSEGFQNHVGEQNSHNGITQQQSSKITPSFGSFRCTSYQMMVITYLFVVIMLVFVCRFLCHNYR